MVVAAAVLLGATPAHADKQFALVQWETNATVNADGSMDIVEAITYTFQDGPFKRGNRTFDADDLDQITNFEVREGEQQLDIVEPPDSELDGYRWLFPEEIIDGTHTYTLSYTVVDAISAGSDVAELYWKFVGDDNPGVGAMRVNISLPTDAPLAQPDSLPTDASLLRAFAHGPLQGTINLTANRVNLDVGQVSPGEFVEARIVAPAGDFTVDSDGEPRLARILDEEAGFQSGDSGPNRGGLGRLLTGISSLLGLGGVGLLGRRYGREPAIDPLIGKYWREPLDDPPAVVLATLGRGGYTNTTAMASTLLDLAQRGHLRIDERKIDKFGPDTTEHTYTYIAKPTDPLRPFELQLLEFVFAGQPTVTGEQISDRATADRSATNAWLTSWKQSVDAEYKAHNYDESGAKATRWLLLIGVCVTVGVVGLIAWKALDTSFGIAGVVLAFGMFAAGSQVLNNRSVAGAEASAKAEGLRSYIKDFSNLEEAPVGHLILWERFLVFAVALGVSRELLAGLAHRLPNVVNDRNFGGFYTGPGGISTIPSFPGSWQSTAGAAIEPPSSSGSGGGFSGGGGGGGGGGSAGAD
jgi:uncharacterized membrane protein